ncbi:MAG: S8 family serine peptidase, partial [Dyadobacter sp.]
TRTSDGSSRNNGGILNNDESDIFTNSCTPLTEYWLRKAAEHNSKHQKAPIVAILDTGIDFQFDWTMCAFPEPDCPLWFNDGGNTKNELEQGPLQKDMIGWNFVGTGDILAPSQHNNPFDDDDTHKHGTRIAALIAQQCRNYKQNNSEDYDKSTDVRLMILKTHDYRGVGFLFDIFCAFDYILLHKEVNIINASWGFYGKQCSGLKSYLEEFAKRKIWFVTAAGNSNDFDDNFRVHELAEKSSTERYPACHCEEFDNVLSVTTALNIKSIDSNSGLAYSEIQPFENYSNRFVDVAIAAGKDGCFPEPLSRVNHVIRGTSFATAYAIGKIVRSGLPAGKGNFFNINNNPFIMVNGNLEKYIKNGYFITSDVDVEKEQF